MNASRQKAAEPATSERQNFEMHKAVKALARCEAVCRSMAVYARFTHALDVVTKKVVQPLEWRDAVEG